MPAIVNPFAIHTSKSLKYVEAISYAIKAPQPFTGRGWGGVRKGDRVMDNLKQIVSEEVAKYAGNGRGANIILFPLLDDQRQTYAVNSVDYPTREDYAG